MSVADTGSEKFKEKYQSNYDSSIEPMKRYFSLFFFFVIFNDFILTMKTKEEFKFSSPIPSNGWFFPDKINSIIYCCSSFSLSKHLKHRDISIGVNLFCCHTQTALHYM